MDVVGDEQRRLIEVELLNPGNFRSCGEVSIGMLTGNDFLGSYPSPVSPLPAGKRRWFKGEALTVWRSGKLAADSVEQGNKYGSFYDQAATPVAAGGLIHSHLRLYYDSIPSSSSSSSSCDPFQLYTRAGGSSSSALP